MNDQMNQVDSQIKDDEDNGLSVNQTATAQPLENPLASAIAISSTTFVAFTSIFVAIIAFVAAAHQMDEVGLASRQRDPSDITKWSAIAIGVAVLINGVYAGARAKANPRLAAITSVIFIVLTVATWMLFLNAW